MFLNQPLEHVYDAAMASQNAWKSGHRSRFEIVDFFLEELLPPELEIDFLPRIKILVTTPLEDDGYAVLEPKSRSELVEYIKRTTWVPYLTGEGIRANDINHQELYLDGGFSRTLHPRCDVEWQLPIMWETLVHTFSPGLTRDQVQSLWERGKNYEYPIPERLRNATANSPVVSPVRRSSNHTFEASSSAFN